MNQTWKRFLSLILALSMALSLMVIPAYAAPEDEDAAAEPAASADTTAVADSEQEEDALPQTGDAEQAAAVAETDDSTNSVLPSTFSISSAALGTMSVDAASVQADADVAVANEVADTAAEPNMDDPVVAAVADELGEVTVQDENGNQVALTEEQQQNVLGMFQQYLQNWTENANVLGVQLPFFLSYNDSKDDLGILGEMLALAGTSVDKVRSGEYSYDDLTGTIMNFMYGDKLGVQYYGDKVLAQAKDAMAAVEASGAQNEAQRLLVLNDWLAGVDSFDMSYIMNSGKDADKRAMVAEDEQKPAHYDDVHQELYNAYKPQIEANFESQIKDEVTKTFHDQIYKGIVTSLRAQYYEKAIPQVLIQSGKTEEEAKAYIETNKAAIEKDPDGFVKENFPDAAEKLIAEADAFVKGAETDGIEVAEGVTMTVEQLTQQELNSNEKKVSFGADGSITMPNDGSAQMTYSEAIDEITKAQMKSDEPTVELGDTKVSVPQAIEIYSTQAADGLTDGVLNYWEGNQFGALAQGKSVCLGYSKALAYLVQYMHPEIYGTAATADMSVSTNWKTAKELYYDADGNIDINKGYVVDLVRITFTDDVVMFGEEQPNFASDHYWNAVKVDGTWYYLDSCYNDVYTEVMARDRVEYDGYVNHMYFLFSHTSAANLFDGYYSELKTLYEKAATNQQYEDAWFARAKSNVSYNNDTAYYVYDSTDTISQKSDTGSGATAFSTSDTVYSLAMHPLTATDKTTGENPGDSDFTSLIDFNYKDTSGDETRTYARVRTLDKDTNEWKMVESEFLTNLFTLHKQQSKTYPNIAITCAYYKDKVYFNLSTCILSYDLSDGTVSVVKQYQTTYGQRDKTVAFGGMSFKLVDSKVDDRYVFDNHPIAGILLRGDELTVSIATNLGYISGKDKITNRSSESNYTIDNKTNGYGYEFEETNYNPSYNNYLNKMLGNMGGTKEINDNDEFMWIANLVGTISMSTLTSGDAVDYKDTSCGDHHHYVEVNETYFTKDSSGSWNTGTSYVCTACGKSVRTPQEKKYGMIENKNYEADKADWDAAVASAGHTYAAADATWTANEDGTYTASFTKLACNICEEKKTSLDCLIDDDTVTVTLSAAATLTTDPEKTTSEGTCADGITTNYVGEGEIKDGDKTYTVTAVNSVKAEAGTHQYEGTFNWVEVKDDDGNVTGYTCETADLKCAKCGDEQKGVKVNLTNETTAATCTEAGKITYTATAVAEDGETVLATETKELTTDKALGHDYKAVFTWAEDNKSATAEITCSRCDLKETKDAAITVESKDATCTKGGTATYTATVTIDGVTLTDSKTVQVEALGHEYGISEVKWSADNSTATATIVCNRCHDSKSQTVNSVSEVVKEANCTEDGSIRYTAVFDVDGANVEYQKNVTVSALGHNYVDGVCTRCGKESEHLTVYAGDGLNYASVYDYNYYIKKYPDVVKKVGTDDAKVLAYFVEQGMAQHQQGSAQFDPVSYRLEYADLRKAYGNTWAGYYRHYVRWGEAAGLHGTGCTEMQNYVTELNGMDYASVYDYNYYIAKYPSVFNKYGYDDAAVLSYFVEKGMTYHQQASAEFDPVSYRFEYADLRKAYGDTWAGYYNHYVRWGKAAGLHGTGCTEMKDYVTVYGSMDYASVYDYNYYIAKYPEVANKIGYDDQKVLNYFVEQGMAQHQQASAQFDPVSYRFEYADLRKAYGDTWAGYYNHYVRWGKAAGLHGTGCTEMKDYVTVYGSMDYASVYDYNYYIAKYPEVLNKVGYDDQKVLNYFVEQGMAQHQQASAEFDPVSYRFEYADLRKAYGDTWAGYYNHYVRWGKAAGLHGTGCTEMKGYVTVYAGNGLDYAAVYDYNYYIAKYPEVLNKVGYDDQKVLNYFVEQGMAQHQQASAEFDPVYYRNSNPSLQNAYGDTWAGYYNHYVRWGKAAGLQGAEQQ